MESRLRIGTLIGQRSSRKPDSSFVSCDLEISDSICFKFSFANPNTIMCAYVDNTDLKIQSIRKCILCGSTQKRLVQLCSKLSLPECFGDRR